MRVLLRAAFDRFTGYGNDAVDMVIHLNARDVDVVPMPTSIMPGLPRKFTRLLEKDPTGRADVVLTFAPPFDVKPWEFAQLAPVAVGYSMWEKSKLIRDDMDGHGWDMRRRNRWWTDTGPAPEDKAKRGVSDLDLMLVTCPMNVDAFKWIDPHCRYDVLPCGVDMELWKAKPRDSDDRMRFGMCGMLAGRKDPFLMLTAWRELKEEHPEFDAILELKTSCPGLHPEIVNVYPDVVLHDRAWPQQKLLEWYWTLDVMVSVSRGEGNNKPAMEFMATGGTVIASDWSGHQNWLHPGVTYPLKGELRPVSPGHPEVEDFRVDKEHLKQTLLHCWLNRHEVREKGRLARPFIEQSLSWEQVCARMDAVLRSLVYR